MSIAEDKGGGVGTQIKAPHMEKKTSRQKKKAPPPPPHKYAELGD